MPNRGIEVVPVKEFGPEQAGSRVGWTAVTEVIREDDAPIFVADITVATIGEHGSSLGYHPIEVDGQPERGYSRNSSVGFTAVSGLQVVINGEQGIVPGSGSVSFGHADSNAFHSNESAILLDGISPSLRPTLDDSDKLWGNNPQEVLTNLKSTLDNAGMRKYYAHIYYLLNGYLGHANFDHKAPNTTSHASLLLPDPEQYDQTKDQVNHALKVSSLLSEAVSADRRQLSQLPSGVSSQIEAELIDDFIASRREANQREIKLQLAASKLLASEIVYLPVGFRPTGRSWRYMDAACSDEDRAFGSELEALKQGMPTSARVELSQELKELRLRRTYASRGHTALALLNSLEQDLIK